MPTATELLDLAPNVGQRASTVRFDLLDINLAPIGTVTPYSDEPPTVQNNINQTIKRTLNEMTLTPADNAAVDPFADRIAPKWVLQDGTEYPLGVFIFGSMDRIRHTWGLEARVSAVDQTIILDQGIDRTVSLAPGDNLRDALVAQFVAARVPVFTIDTTILTKVASPIAWTAGTSRLKVINEMAALAGCFSAYFDNDGRGWVRKVDDGTVVTPGLVYDSGGRILTDSMVESDDLLDAPNRFLVIDSANAEAPVYASYDVPPDAPHSAFHRGFVITKTIPEQGLASRHDAHERAFAAYVQEPGGYQWVQFSSPPDPRHDTFQNVAYLGTVYREQGWNLPLREGSEMTHDLRRVYT